MMMFKFHGPAKTEGAVAIACMQLRRLWFWCRVLLIWKSVPAPLGAAEILQCRKGVVNGKCQLVNVGGCGRWLGTNQSPDECGCPPRTDPQYPVATLYPTHDCSKL
jgi:hypothetical protein